MQNTAVVCVLALTLCLTASARPNVEHADAKVTSGPGVPDTPSTKLSSPHAAQPANIDNRTTTVVPTKISDLPTVSVIPTKATNETTTTIEPVVTKKPNVTTPSMASTHTPTTPTSVAPTSKLTVPSTTEHFKVVSTTAVPLMARGFDGPSFIGGIILTLGLLAVTFMGFKYYKTQTEGNYHIL